MAVHKLVFDKFQLVYELYLDNTSSDEDDYFEKEHIRRQNIAYNMSKVSSDLSYLIPKSGLATRKETNNNILNLSSLEDITSNESDSNSISDPRPSVSKKRKETKTSKNIKLVIALVVPVPLPMKKIVKSPRVNKFENFVKIFFIHKRGSKGVKPGKIGNRVISIPGWKGLKNRRSK